MKKAAALLTALLVISCAFAAQAQDWPRLYSEILPLECTPARYLANDPDSHNYSLLDAGGSVLEENYISWCGIFREGFAPVGSPDSLEDSAFINASGELITGFDFHNGGWYGERSFSEGLACVVFAETGRYGCINTAGETVLAPEYEWLGSFREGLACFRGENDLYGYINSAGETIIEPLYTDAEAFSCGRAAVMDQDHRWGFIDTAGEVVIPMQYALAGSFSEGLAAVEQPDGYKGYIRTDGSFAVEPAYCSAAEFVNGYAVTTTGDPSADISFAGPDDGWYQGVIDAEGRVVIPHIYDSVYIQRGANITPAETTAAARLGDAFHFYRFENGRVLRTGGLVRSYDAWDRLKDAALADPAEPCIELNAAQPPCILSMQPLAGLQYRLLQSAAYEINRINAFNSGLHNLLFHPSGMDYDLGLLHTGYGDLMLACEPALAELSADGLDVQPVARDALIFLAAEDCPVDNLSTDQLRRIYSGEITDWSELGATRSLPVTAYLPDGSDWTGMVFSNVLQGVIPARPPQEYIESEYGDTLENCMFRAIPGGLGCEMRSLLEGADMSGMKILTINGAAPTPENIACGAYPLTAEICAITREGDDDPNLQILLNWLASDPGRELFSACGLVPAPNQGDQHA